MQTVGSHLLLNNAILVLLMPKAIHENRLIRLPRQRGHCGTLPLARTIDASTLAPLTVLRTQNQHAQWRQIQRQRHRLTMMRFILGEDPSAIAIIRTGIRVRIAVDHLAPTPGERYADLVGFT